jgi:rhodanese-related sulfurtransferase
MSVLAALGKLFIKPYRTITATDAGTLLADGAVLLDVRDRHEWQAGHAPKARHIPLAQLVDRHRELPAGRTIITVCRSGMRSAQAARLLAAQGWQVVNLSGGMHAWARAGLPITAKAGSGRII